MKNLVLTTIIFFIFTLTAFAASPESILPFQPDDTLEEIRYKIDHNGYDFTVSDNPIFSLTPEEKSRFFSRHASTVPRRSVQTTGIGPLAGRLGTVDPPEEFDWRDYNGHSYIGPIRDQGGCGSCYAFGACASAEGTYNFAMGLYDGNCVDFSESYIIWCLGRLAAYNPHFFGCKGSDYDYAELTALTVEGVANEADFPYVEGDPGCTHWGDQTTAFSSWHRISCNDVTAIKTAIMTYGVVDAAVVSIGAFSAYSSGVYEDLKTTCGSYPCYETPTDHIIALVGWDDTPPEGGGGCWILRNSWGDSWGESGYMRIRYTSARVACEAAYLVYSTPTPVPTPTPSSSPSPSITPTPTSTPAPSPSATPTATAVAPSPVIPSPTPTFSVTPTSPPTPAPTLTVTPTVVPSRTPTPEPTPSPTLSPPPSPSPSLTVSATVSPTPSPRITATPGSTASPTVTVTPTPTCGPTISPEMYSIGSGDYNGDGTVDIAIYRGLSGFWAVRDITRLYFGGNSDLPVPADYDGNGSTDMAIFRPSSGLWAVWGSDPSYFGRYGDIPIPGDYDSDGRADIAIFREASGLWAIRGRTRIYFGGVDDWPVAGDYRGDGGIQIAFFRSSSGLWAIQGVTRVYFGGEGDRPATADYSGDGTADIGIYRPCTGLWAIRGMTRAYYGSCRDRPEPADYTGDGTSGLAIFREDSGLWAIRGATRVYFGSEGDIPVTK